MTHQIKYTLMICLAAMVVLQVHEAGAQIRLVNMVPKNQSNQTSDDAEPNVAVNPANRQQVVGSAFTPDPMGGPNAPIYISTDGGVTWALNSIIPGNDATYGTGDITERFAGSGNQLYVGDLRGGAWLTLNLMRVPDFTATVVPTPVVSRANVDQPYVQAATVLGGGDVTKDKVFSTTNDHAASHTPAGIDISQDAFSTPAPAGFSLNIFPNRASTSRVEPGVRPTIHPSGVVYIAFYSMTASGADVIVARDDNWGNGANPFQNLTDTADALPGQRVVVGRTLPAFGGNQLGNSRLVASNISVAVDPTNAATVYVAWADRVSTTDYTLHVRRSTNSGQNWSGDWLTITNATNPALAVNSAGKVAFLYQQLTGSGASTRWVTHFRTLTSGGASWSDVTLHTALMSDPGNWLGDYDHVLAIGKDFYGIFTGSNNPTLANFPQGVTYQRNANWTSHQLLGIDSSTVIGGSLDPFFFHDTELADNKDFYVRDFTNSGSDFDPGLEPSTYPWFYVNSDVWNKRSNAAGSFNGNNQPESEDPWQTTDGHNYAFARVHRKGTGAGQSVTMHYLVSEFGTGSNFENANSTADPTLPFGAADLELTATSGYEWELPVTMSNHTCLAVEISTPDDPIINPSLWHHTPGWSNGTDLMVLNDNNKAQRNMEVYRLPDTGGGSVTSYAAIHNPTVHEMDMGIEWRPGLNPREKSRMSAGIVSRSKSQTVNNGIVLLNMKPGETRFMKISFPVTSAMQTFDFSNVKNGVVVNGFTEGRGYASEDKVVEQNVRYEALEMLRVGKLYRIGEAEGIRKTDLEFLDKKQFTSVAYLSLADGSLAALKAVVAQLVQHDANDPFELKTAYTQYETQVKNKKGVAAMAAQLSLLNAMDAFMTSLQLLKGNTADLLQTVYVQRDAMQQFLKKKNIAAGQSVQNASNKFIAAVESKKQTTQAYPDHVKQVLPGLKACVDAMPSNAALVTALGTVQQSLGDVTALQKAHMEFLLAWRAAVKAMP